MPARLLTQSDPACLPLHFYGEGDYAERLKRLAPGQQRWLEAQAFKPERGRWAPLPGKDGELEAIAVGLGSSAATAPWLWDGAHLAEKLPERSYRLSEPLPAAAATEFTTGWLMGTARGARGVASNAATAAALELPAHADAAYAQAMAGALTQARDLINAPANELGPDELADAIAQMAAARGATLRRISGAALEREYPLVHAVGMGSARAPTLIECHWSRPGARRVALVGKGVCFDSGGLDIKPSSGMLLMKKDMAGAACALATARALIDLGAPIDLRLIVPAVENSVGGRSFRPGDVFRSRKGLSVEIGNTDAEGRLVLADALALAEEGAPDLMVDFATLTGAARTALGPELPAVFSGNADLPASLARIGAELHDPSWPLPLWLGYDDELASRVADINNVASSAFAGAIFGALFLRRFVARPAQWLHVDLYGWNTKERPGRPTGAEPQCVRALYALLRAQFG